MNRQFEVCANSAESALAAQAGGATRVELCAGIPEGGTTPSCGEIAMARSLLTTTRLHVIIRPRGGDFLYSPQEQQIMLTDIAQARRLKVDGLVFGCLTPEGEIDLPLLKRFIEAAGGLPVTFHRAFDVCRAPQEALEQLIQAGVQRILTSGAQPTADKGIPLLKALNRQAAGRIALMAGSGVNETNIARIAAETGIREFHFSARRPVDSGMRYRNPAVSMSSREQPEEAYSRLVTDPERVRATIEAAGIA